MNQKGVTLYELLIVIVVMGLVSGFAIPSMANVIENTNKDKVLNDALTVENSARLYCYASMCEDGQVLTDEELSNYIEYGNTSYTYSATYYDNGLVSVSYIKEGEFSFPVDMNGLELEDRIPSLSSRELVNKIGEADGEDPSEPVIPEGEPYVLLNGSSTVYVEIGTNYDSIDPMAKGYTSEGNIIGSVWASDYPNYWQFGVYVKKYHCYSAFDNKSCIPAERTIMVVDTTPPIIHLNGQRNTTVSAGTWWVPNGVNYVEDQSSYTLTTTGDVLQYPLAAGTYVITHTAVDSFGNTTVETQTIIAN